MPPTTPLIMASLPKMPTAIVFMSGINNAADGVVRRFASPKSLSLASHTITSAGTRIKSIPKKIRRARRAAAVSRWPRTVTIMMIAMLTMAMIGRISKSVSIPLLMVGRFARVEVLVGCPLAWALFVKDALVSGAEKAPDSSILWAVNSVASC